MTTTMPTPAEELAAYIDEAVAEVLDNAGVDAEILNRAGGLLGKVKVLVGHARDLQARMDAIVADCTCDDESSYRDPRCRTHGPVAGLHDLTAVGVHWRSTKVEAHFQAIVGDIILSGLHQGLSAAELCKPASFFGYGCRTCCATDKKLPLCDDLGDCPTCQGGSEDYYRKVLLERLPRSAAYLAKEKGAES